MNPEVQNKTQEGPNWSRGN